MGRLLLVDLEDLLDLDFLGYLLVRLDLGLLDLLYHLSYLLDLELPSDQLNQLVLDHLDRLDFLEDQLVLDFLEVQLALSLPELLVDRLDL